MIHLRDDIVNSLIKHAEGEIARHRANVMVFLTYPSGVGEHSDLMTAIENELDGIAKYHNQINILKEYFDA